MRVALVPWVQTEGPRGTKVWRPDVDAGRWAVIDLRGHGVNAAIIVAPDRDTALSKALVDLGDDATARLGARRRRLGSRLGLTLSSTDTLGSALVEKFGDALKPALQPDGRYRHQLVCAGQVLYDAAAIRGGATDTFTYSNGGLESVSSGAWSSGGLDGTVNVASGEVVFLDGFEWRTVIYTTSMGTVDHYSQGRCRYNASSSDFSLGPVVRNQTNTGGEPFAGSKYLSFVDNTNGAGVYAVVSGTPTLILQDDDAFDDDSVMRLTANGSTISLTRDASPLLSTTNTSVSTGNYAGFYMQRFNGGGVTNIWFDNWEGAPVSTTVTLTVADASHAHTADAPSLAQAHSLVVADATHGHTAESPTLVEDVTLTVADALHGHTADSPSLTQAHTLVVADAAHALASDAPTLSQAHTLTVADALHGHTADGPTLTQAHSLTVADATHAHTAESPTPTTGTTLSVADATHAHAADSPALTQAHTLVVADALHGHAADNVTVDTAGTITVADATHGHVADNVTLTQAHTLVVQDALHAHTADSPEPSTATTLSVDSATHAHTVDGPTISQVHVIAVDGTVHAHTADALTLSQVHALVVADASHAHTAGTVAFVTLFVDGPTFTGTEPGAIRRRELAAIARSESRPIRRRSR